MGCEFGQSSEWDHDQSIDWHLLDEPLHAGVMTWVKDIYRLYKENSALWNDHPDGFEWIDFGDRENSTISYIRRNRGRELIFMLNFTPVPRSNYRVGVPQEGTWMERLNSDAEVYGGSGIGNLGGVDTNPVPYHGRPISVVLTLPPLSVVVLERES
jgi:1,4-alpha-glucan branching enzyme